MIRKLRKLAQLSPCQCWLLFESLLVLSWTHIGLFGPFDRWRKSLLATTRRRRVALKPAGTSCELGSIVRMFDIASRHLPLNDTCLSRSIALQGILSRRGIDSTLCLGVRRGDQAVEAHAWLEQAGVVVNDSAANIADYSRLAPADPEAQLCLAR